MATYKKLMSSLKSGVLPLDEFFSADLYTGSASSVTVTNGIDLADGGLLWVKRRNADATLFFDTARGTGQRLMTPPQDGELNIGGVTFNSTGFTLDPTNTTNYPANNGQPYVAYSIKEAPKLFDIVTYTGNGVAGREIPHNLGAEPSLIFVKRRSGSANWQAWTKHGSPQSYTYRFSPTETTDWRDSFTSVWGSDTSYTFDESVFTVGTGATVNQSGNTYVAYLFANQPDGPLRIGAYTGNGGFQFVDLGFTSGARFVLIKSLTGFRSWFVWDTARGIGGSTEPYSRLDVSGADVTSNDYVFPYSAGFGLRPTDQVNGSGETYLYMAIGE